MKQELWAKRQLLTTTWLDALTRRVTQLQEALTRLADQQQTWTQTQDAARAAKAPEPMLAQIAGVLRRDRSSPDAAARPSARSRSISRAASPGRWLAVRRALAQVAEAQTPRGGRAPGAGASADLERPVVDGRADPSTFRTVREIAAGWWREVIQDLRDPADRRAGRTRALFVVLAALLWAARRWTHRSAAEEGASVATAVFDRPFSAALLIGLVTHPFVYGPAGPEARQLFQVVLLVPVIRLTRPVVDPRAVPWPPHAGRRVHP